MRTRSSLAAPAIRSSVRRGRAELGVGVFGACPASGGGGRGVCAEVGLLRGSVGVRQVVFPKDISCENLHSKVQSFLFASPSIEKAVVEGANSNEFKF